VLVENNSVNITAGLCFLDAAIMTRLLSLAGNERGGSEAAAIASRLFNILRSKDSNLDGQFLEPRGCLGT
jgi:hypothetical protein